MNPTTPTVSVIIASYNEAVCIERCLRSLLAQTYARIIEIMVVDGKSTDATVRIVQSVMLENDKIKLLTNEKRQVPFAWNIGIQHAQGEIICIQGAHAALPMDYIAHCVALHVRMPEVANVGGKQIVLPRTTTAIARANALAIVHPFGIGNAQYRQAHAAGYVYTVFPGCYKREVFQQVGLYDERLFRGEDQEMNARIIAAGKKIFMDPAFSVFFYARGTLRELALLYFRTGRSVVFTSMVMSKPVSVRQFVPVGFLIMLAAALAWWIRPVPGCTASCACMPMIGIAGLYGLVLGWHAVSTACKQRSVSLLWALPAAFITIHFSYGIGTLVGMITLPGWWRRNRHYIVKKIVDNLWASPGRQIH
jgi:glycosyltransferase involved in cell wall biosynthesis